MLAHSTGEALASRRTRDHVAAITDMLTGPVVIGLEIVGPKNFATFLEHKRSIGLFHPQTLRRLDIGVYWVGVGVARLRNLAKNGPDVRPVSGCCFADHD